MTISSSIIRSAQFCHRIPPSQTIITIIIARNTPLLDKYTILILDFYIYVPYVYRISIGCMYI